MDLENDFVHKKHQNLCKTLLSRKNYGPEPTHKLRSSALNETVDVQNGIPTQKSRLFKVDVFVIKLIYVNKIFKDIYLVQISLAFCFI